MAYDRIGNLKGSTPDDTKLRALILAVLKTVTWGRNCQAESSTAAMPARSRSSGIATYTCVVSTLA